MTITLKEAQSMLARRNVQKRWSKLSKEERKAWGLKNAQKRKANARKKARLERQKLSTG